MSIYGNLKRLIGIRESVKTKIISDNDIDKQYYSETYFKDNDGSWNCIVYMDGKENIPYRGRVEGIIINPKTNQILIDFEANKYKIPGGSWDYNESHQDAVIREIKEEVRITVYDNPKYIGNYLRHDTEVKKWVSEKIDKKYAWKDFYNEVYLCIYNKPYMGYIAPKDRDEMIDKVKWYNFDEVYNLLNPVHKRAIDIYKKGNY